MRPAIRPERMGGATASAFARAVLAQRYPDEPVRFIAPLRFISARPFLPRVQKLSGPS